MAHQLLSQSEHSDFIKDLELPKVFADILGFQTKKNLTPKTS